jgi:putative peptidoglycan lipid II flippase
MARRASTVAVFTLGSRILGYVRDATLAHAFGAGLALDAFVAAQTIPNVFRRLVAEGTLMIAFVPLLTEERERGGLPAARRFVGAVLGLLIPVLLLITAAGVALPGLFVDAFAAGFDEERARLAESLTRVMMPYLFFVSLVAVAGGALNAFGVFGAPAAAPILLNLAIIACVLGFASRLEAPVQAAAWGVLLGGVLQLALQLPFLARCGLWVGPRWDPRNPAVQRLLVRMGPAVFGVGVYQLNLVVIRQIASFLPGGQLSCYFYATRLEEFALGVFAVSISIAALPTLSEHAARGDRAAFLATFRQALRATNFVTIPSMVGLGALATPIVGTLFRHGAFQPSDADLTARLLTVMAVALVPIGMVRVMVPTYYAVGETARPVWAAAGSLVTTAGLGVALGARLEVLGLTVATASAALVQALLLVVWFRPVVLDRWEGPAARDPSAASDDASRQEGAVIRDSGGWGHALRCALAVFPWIVLARWLSTLVDWYTAPAGFRAAALAGLVGLVALGYAVGAQFLRLPEMEPILAAVRRRMR